LIVGDVVDLECVGVDVAQRQVGRAGGVDWGDARNCQSKPSRSWNLLKSAPLVKKTECVMDWNRIEGNWKQFKGRAKEKWGRLTDDDLDVVNGRRDQLEGKIQERYGLAKDKAKQDVDAWSNSLTNIT
jgi:uncharacterized protein YjbJ (UPF0337 family)